MRFFIFALLQVLVFLPLLPIASFASDNVKIPGAVEAPKTGITEVQKAAVSESYGKLPLYFIENKGQVDRAVKFYEKGAGHATFFTEDGVVIALTKSESKAEKTSYYKSMRQGLKMKRPEKAATGAVRLTFIGANKKARITSSSPLPGHVNYFVGNDKTKWQSNVPTYRAVTYEKVFENIDIKFYGNNRDIEHDIIVRPGGDPSIVKFAYEGIEGLKIAENGDLEVSLNGGKIIEKRPFIYQEIKGERKTIDGSYRILKDEDNAFSYGYKVASYDRTKELVIDPVLEYSTYLGGSHSSSVHGIAIDFSGAAYVTGWTNSTDFPIVSPIQGTFGGLFDIIVTKINPAGTAILYSTYLGGSENEDGYGIAVDATGAVYITGKTASTDFPLVNAIQGIYGGAGPGPWIFGDSFITKLDPTGSAITYSTYLGGNGLDIGWAIAVDSTGAASVTGETDSTDFPLANPLQSTLGFGGDKDAFVTKVNPAGSAFVYSTYLGGNGSDMSRGIAVDSAGAAYVVGDTQSTDFPIASPIQGTKTEPLDHDLFITKITPTGSALVYSTYLGGTGSDHGRDIAVDSDGAAYVTGYSFSPTDYPLVNPIQGANANYGYSDVIVTKINPAGSALLYSTYLGGTHLDYGYAIAIDNTGAAYISGFSSSLDYPVVSPLQETYAEYFDAIITKINPEGSAIIYSTYLGGNSDDSVRDIAVDSSGAAYLGGLAMSTDFPLVHPLKVIKHGCCEYAFVAKISPGTPPVLSLEITPDIFYVSQGSTLGYTVTATNTTAIQQCFQYWENVSLQDGTTYPATGELFGPIKLCLDAGASQSTPLTHGVPLSTPLGRYALNAYVGAYAFPVFPVVVNEAHFTFDVTAFNPATQNPNYSWRFIESGL